ncbi:lactate utilization protein [Crenobacter sp. SG2303]|uniref:Lactate utilization protein n=1 Tax=Crenobacter oryzisoli TaxID=3056844 RepID=A0ABT7XTM3_9NEIS|nr:lactate utilization protein [Crenobacter sp. SG2303]MDN0077075.1 lactate utilization protein [Crenobacter sp. SG2303]
MSARDNILAKLRAAPRSAPVEPDIAAHFEHFGPRWNEVEALRHWAAMMRSVKTDIVWCHAADWPQRLAEQVKARPVRSLLLAPQTAHGALAHAALEHNPLLTLKSFDRVVDEWKDELFNDTDAAFTAVRCGIAATGTLVLWPDADEPRTMSLVPPTHFALFDTRTLHADFHTAMTREAWPNGMPTNALLVSGPSKTADIQLTLAYGAHGPRDLVVLAVLPHHLTVAQLEDAA